MEIVMTGFAGLSGSSALAERYREKLRERLPDWLLAKASALAESEAEDVPEAFGAAVCAVPIGRGGVFDALWNLAERAQEVLGVPAVGLRVQLKEIPILQETIEICEILNQNPYQLPSGGWLGLFLEGWRSEGRVIGHCAPGRARVVEGPSGIRYLEKPRNRGEEMV